jgi:hypothetical protein
MSPGDEEGSEYETGGLLIFEEWEVQQAELEFNDHKRTDNSPLEKFKNLRRNK